MDERLTHLQAVLGNRYTLERELGRGGMATVWLAVGGATLAVDLKEPV